MFYCFQSNHEKLHISPTLANKLRVLQNHSQLQTTIVLQNTTIEMEAGFSFISQAKGKESGELKAVYKFPDADKASSCVDMENEVSFKRLHVI